MKKNHLQNSFNTLHTFIKSCQYNVTSTIAKKVYNYRRIQNGGYFCWQEAYVQPLLRTDGALSTPRVAL